MIGPRLNLRTNYSMSTQSTDNTTIDLGCGPNKVAGAFGVDIHAYPGVDQVFDINKGSWPLPSNHYQRIYARHIIEHVAYIPDFMNEIHRIAADGAIVEIITPHFSSLHSWEDPTHRWHLSCGWHNTFTKNYLSEQMQTFEHIKTDIGFSKSLRSRIGLLITRISSIEYWEKHYAFIFRGKNILTQLKVVKSNT